MREIDQSRADVLRDISLQLLDACRADIERAHGSQKHTPVERAAAAMCLAVQTVFLCEAMTEQHSEGVVAMDRDRAKGMFMGLGQGAAHCIAGSGEAESVEFAMQTYMLGFSHSFTARMGISREAFDRSKFGKGGAS